MEVNDAKLTNAVKAKEMRPATEDEIRATGAVPGFASPMGLENCLVVVDDLIPRSPNLVSGANQENYHMMNVNYGRDYEAEIVTDIASAGEGVPCPRCGQPVSLTRGVEIGNIFKLGTRYTEALGCTFLDAHGRQRPVIMGSYGIGSGRLLASAAEEHNDENGLIWPISIAPFQVHLVSLKGAEAPADRLYDELNASGIEVLYDDRQERPGVKFNDADLIGIPLRVTVSERAKKQGGVELKLRSQKDHAIVPDEQVASRINEQIGNLESELSKKVVEMPYEED
jgi:prolyl-tRNA synthetase